MPKVQVLHIASPVCDWSWGYEPVMNRLQMIYGKQVDFVVPLAIPYSTREKWLEDYGMTGEEALEWSEKEVRPMLPMPTRRFRSWMEMPESCVPPTIAVYAAGLVHGPEAEKRLTRALLFSVFVEGKDVSQDKVLEEVIESCGLDNARMGKVAQDNQAIDKAMEHDMLRAGHGGNFYSIVVRDHQNDKNTVVQLAHAYDPARIERAIDYMAGKTLKKKKPTDVEAYVEAHGPVCAEEIRTVFAIPLAQAKSKLAALEKRGTIERVPAPQVATKFYKTSG